MSLIGDAVESDLEFLKKLSSWLEDKDSYWSEPLNAIIDRYEVISGAYLTKLRNTPNQEVEKWKRENL